jgi:hypothetical protein
VRVRIDHGPSLGALQRVSSWAPKGYEKCCATEVEDFGS